MASIAYRSSHRAFPAESAERGCVCASTQSPVPAVSDRAGRCAASPDPAAPGARLAPGRVQRPRDLHRPVARQHDLAAAHLGRLRLDHAADGDLAFHQPLRGGGGDQDMAARIVDAPRRGLAVLNVGCDEEPTVGLPHVGQIVRVVLKLLIAPSMIAPIVIPSAFVDAAVAVVEGFLPQNDVGVDG